MYNKTPYEIAEEYLDPGKVRIVGIRLRGEEAFVLVRASLGDFSLQLLRDRNGSWAVAAELDAKDYYDYEEKNSH